MNNNPKDYVIDIKDDYYVVFKKILMNNLLGCESYFYQEVYRSLYKTQKLKSFMRS